jgi:hypothetical protein
VTKPGNSDPADRPVDSKEPAAEPTPESNGEAATDTTPEPAPEPDTTPEPDPEPEPEAVAEKEKPVVAEPASAAEFEKAPPVPDEPVMPTAAEAARRRSDLPRPKVLRIAFYLAIASAVVGIYSAIELFLNKADLVRSAQTIKTPNPLTPEEAERAVTSLLWLYLVVVVVLGAFITLFVYKAQDGVRRARMMAMIVTLILLIFHFYFFGTAFGQISGLFGAITIALLYLPSTREYFGPRQTVR